MEGTPPDPVFRNDSVCGIRKIAALPPTMFMCANLIPGHYPRGHFQIETNRRPTSLGQWEAVAVGWELSMFAVGFVEGQ